MHVGRNSGSEPVSRKNATLITFAKERALTNSSFNNLTSRLCHCILVYLLSSSFLVRQSREIERVATVANYKLKIDSFDFWVSLKSRAKH